MEVLMFRDVDVAKFRDGFLSEVLNRELLPTYFKNSLSLDLWLSNREADCTRGNVSIIAARLGIDKYKNGALARCSHAVSMIDNYWIRDEMEKICWADVRPADCDVCTKFLELDLDIDRDNIPLKSYEFCNNGSFEKCWINRYGRWILQKAGQPEEIFSEIVSSRIGKLLGFDTVQYRSSEDHQCAVECDSFMKEDDFQFEPAIYWMGWNDELIANWKKLKEMGFNLEHKWFEMCMLDVICFNSDRHVNNFGVLRQVFTNELKMAPGFDYNIALVVAATDSALRDRYMSEMENQFERFCKFTNAGLYYRMSSLGESTKERFAYLLERDCNGNRRIYNEVQCICEDVCDEIDNSDLKEYSDNVAQFIEFGLRYVNNVVFEQTDPYAETKLLFNL